ncbi:Clp protease N-terminal domain-containing protein [Lentzea alba]|uniref:Clp protease N-terminal domain-containing protein n=1 Tax=Lentzea alba TaxID=2714351 RepID=UPI0039BF3EA0
MIASSHARSALSVALTSASRGDFVGTVDLLIGLLTLDGVGRRLNLDPLRKQALDARWANNWSDDDGGVGGEARADVVALLSQAERFNGSVTCPESLALRECLTRALDDAGAGVLTTAHLMLALLRQETGRAAELFAAQRVDVEALIATVPEVAKPEYTPAVEVLKDSGALEGQPRGGFWRWIMPLHTRFNRFGALSVAVNGEAHRLAAGARPTAAEVLAAILAVDDQLVAAGLRLLPAHGSAAADVLRAAGLDVAGLLAVESPAVDGVRLHKDAKRIAARCGDAVVEPMHLLLALLEDPADPLASVLADRPLPMAGWQTR